MLRWLRGRQEARRLAQTDAEALDPRPGAEASGPKRGRRVSRFRRLPRSATVPYSETCLGRICLRRGTA